MSDNNNNRDGLNTISKTMHPSDTASSRIRVKLPGSHQAASVYFPSRPQIATSPPPRSADSVLKHLYETGEYSDLTVNAGGTIFEVHKSIVCPASAWLEKECQDMGSLIEAFATPHIVDSIFRHLYAMDVPVLVAAKLGPGTSAQETANKDLCNVLDLMLTSTYWGLGDLAAQSTDVLATKLQLYALYPETIAFIAAGTYDSAAHFTPEFNEAICRIASKAKSIAVEAIVKILPTVMGNPAAEKHIVKNAELMRAVLALTAQRMGATTGGIKRPGEILESDRQKRSRDDAA
ncbi:hypothetical protein Q7P37_005223 [Cladosporium fusiforme]